MSNFEPSIFMGRFTLFEPVKKMVKNFGMTDLQVKENRCSCLNFFVSKSFFDLHSNVKSKKGYLKKSKKVCSSQNVFYCHPLSNFQPSIFMGRFTLFEPVKKIVKNLSMTDLEVKENRCSPLNFFVSKIFFDLHSNLKSKKRYLK